MRAVVVETFGPIENAKLGDMPKPTPQPGELLVEVRATAANFVDLLVIAGKYQFSPALPFIPGKGPSGVVAALGDGVTGFAVGDRVLAMAEQGGFGAFVSVRARDCYNLPEAISFVDAAASAVIYDTAWIALHDRARLAKDETVLVLGATGGVGLAAIQLAKAAGAKVLAGIASPAKADIVRDAGADAVIDLAAPDLHETVRAQVYAHTGKRGADVILDMLGGDIFDAAIRALAWRGRLVVIGFAAGRIPTIKANYLLLKNIEVSGMQVSDYRKRTPDLMDRCFADIFAQLASGALKPLPVKTYPIADFAAGLREIRDRTQRGRIVLTQSD
jgi:NADPH2:quinone reductase